MTAQVYSRGLYLGETIQEKTRSLLGWNNEFCPTVMVDTQMPYSKRHHLTSRRQPYAIPGGRVRKNSSSSSSSSTCSDYSQPSPSYSIRSYPESLSPEPMGLNQGEAATSPLSHYPACNPAFRSAERDARVFERLRQLVPVLPSDRNAYQVLIDTVSQVMDLEHQLEKLNEQTEGVKNSLRLEADFHDYDDCLFPDDLQSVDVTAFKHLLRSDSPSSLSSLDLNALS